MSLLRLFPLSSPLFACAVCFGQSQTPGIAKGLILAGGVLLGFTFLMVGGIVYAVWQVEKRRAQAEKAALP